MQAMSVHATELKQEVTQLQLDRARHHGSAGFIKACRPFSHQVRAFKCSSKPLKRFSFLHMLQTHLVFTPER